MFSNGLLVSDIAAVNSEGVLSRSGWADRGSDDLAAIGQRIFRTQCSSCHTLDGYQGICGLLPSYGEMYALATDDPPGSAEQVFGAECAACNADLTGSDMLEMMPSAAEMAEDPEMIHDLVSGMITGSLVSLQEMGLDYANSPKGVVIDTADFHAPYMPPFVGTDAELEALATYLAAVSRNDDTPQRLARSGGVE